MTAPSSHRNEDSRLMAPLAAWIAVSFAFALGCASTPIQKRESAGMPDRDTFGPVSKVLMRRCGSLDCHGSAYRNFRLVGFGGWRLDPDHLPDAPDTTDEELDANYESLVGLEPALMREVVQNKGSNAGKLTLLRKGRGTEAHKGGRRIGVGDEADLCIISWLHDEVNTDLCVRAGGKTP